MVTTDTLIWLVLAATAAVCIVSMLGVFASVMYHETELHDLRNRVAELQYSYTLQLARLHGHIEEEDGAVDIVEDTPAGSAGAVEAAEAVEPRAAA
jgi:hypothetical protein